MAELSAAGRYLAARRHRERLAVLPATADRIMAGLATLAAVAFVAAAILGVLP